jgi:DNA-binding MarR family transcriptional regulator
MSSIFNPSDQDNIDRKIAVGLERISQALKVLIWQESKSSGLSPIQIQFLIALLCERNIDWTIGALASRFSLTAATVSDAVSSLMQKGLVIRTRPPEDRRNVFVSLTEKGRTAGRSFGGWANALQKNVSALSHEQKQTLFTSVMTILHGLQQDGFINNVRSCLSCAYLDTTTERSAQKKYMCSYLKTSFEEYELRADCTLHVAGTARE